jgi:predicted CopG family antitoxin
MTKYTITVNDELWREFKKTITKDRTINEAIVELIKQKTETKK